MTRVALCAAIVSMIAPAVLAQQGGATSSSTTTAASSAAPSEKSLDDLLKESDTRVIAVPQGFLPDAQAAVLRTVNSACVIDGGAAANVRNAIGAVAEQYAFAPVDAAFPLFVHVLRLAQDTGSPIDCWFQVERGTGVVSRANPARLYGERHFGVLFLHLDVANLLANTPVESLNARYYTNIKSKLPQNVQNLIALLRLATIIPAQSANRRSYYGFGYESSIPRTADIIVLPTRDVSGKPELVGRRLAIDNEARHWWDVSVGVPITKLTGLEYSAENGQFNPKEVNKQTAYGLLNIFYPTDLKNVEWTRYLPRILVGPGITGRPGDRFFIGGGIGNRYFQVFAGSAFAVYDVVPPEGSAAQAVQKYRSRFAMGINVPVLAAIKAIGGE